MEQNLTVMYRCHRLEAHTVTGIVASDAIFALGNGSTEEKDVLSNRSGYRNQTLAGTPGSSTREAVEAGALQVAPPQPAGIQARVANSDRVRAQGEPGG